MTTRRHDRNAVLASVDLDALADHLLGDHHHTPTRTWPCPNPDHFQTGRTPPVTTYRNRRNEQRWHCHGCGADGTAIDLLILTRDHTVRSALDWLASHPSLPPAPMRIAAAASAPSPDTRLDEYVDACQRYLHGPAGIRALRWLTTTRGLDLDVLNINRIGYDPGPDILSRREGIPRSPGVVLPVVDEHGRAVFTQTRVLNPHGRLRYLNTATHVAANPQVASIRPPHARPSGPTLACEGMIDALTAATAGFEALAVLSASAPIQPIRLHLERAPDVVVAFDADPAGDNAAHALLDALAVTHPTARRLRPPAPHGDLNAWHRRDRHWPRHVEIRHHRAASQTKPGGRRALER